MKFFYQNFVRAILSGMLLFLAYPPFSLGFLAWFAFVPFFFALVRAPSRRTAFFTGYVTGLVFFFLGIQWLIHVTAVGWLLVTAFEALFFGLFALLVFNGARHVPGPVIRILWISLAWTATEFFRAEFPVLGFGWNLLGYSQAFYETVIQSANVFGVYGLGFAIMAVNALLYETIDHRPQTIDPRLQTGNPKIKKSILSMVYGLWSMVFVLILLLSHGLDHKARTGEHHGDFRVSVIQGNIPQSVKWELVARSQIIEIYSKLTELAAFDEPSLMIWPEAAFPGYFNRDFDAQLVQELARKIEIPILVGAPYWEKGDKAYNSAYLLDTDGEIGKRYDKQILVPFGEYVPMKGMLAWLAPYVYALGVGDFSAGREKTVFDILNHEVSFSVLICFEDTIPELSRQFVNRGAQFLAVITNDAWFGNTGAAAQHLQASIFRAVENGVPVVRAANTGVSAFISNRGKVLDRVRDEKGRELFVTGRKTLPLPLEIKDTLYRQGGWLFPYVASGVFVIMLIFNKRTENRAQRTDKKRKS